MEKQYTAVEWLIDQMFKQGYFDGNKPLTYTNLDHLQQQAKEIEQEQIMNAWVKGVVSEGDMTARQYYNETYEK